MQEQVELRDIIFENVDSILNLAPEQNQQRFVEPVSKIIALAYAGINEKCAGFLQAVYYNGQPAGVILIGKSHVSEEEPDVLQKYEYAYRIVGFFIDKNYQRKGIGKAALRLALEKLKAYPESNNLPVYLECHIENKVALALYESFGFQNINVIFRDDYSVLICFPNK